FDLAVEPLVLAELPEKALLNACCLQASPVLEDEMAQFVGEYHRQLAIAGSGREAVINLDNAAVGSRFERIRGPDLDQRAAADGSVQWGVESPFAAHENEIERRIARLGRESGENGVPQGSLRGGRHLRDLLAFDGYQSIAGADTGRLGR